MARLKATPAFQFYPDDFLGSGFVQGLDAEEVGAYVLLLFHDWQEIGFAYNEKRLAIVCRLPVPKFRAFWKQVKDKFPERDGRHFNPRLEAERTKQAEYKKTSSDRGRKGAEARWNKDAQGNAPSMPEASDEYVKALLADSRGDGRENDSPVSQFSFPSSQSLTNPSAKHTEQGSLSGESDAPPLKLEKAS